MSYGKRARKRRQAQQERTINQRCDAVRTRIREAMEEILAEGERADVVLAGATQQVVAFAFVNRVPLSELIRIIPDYHDQFRAAAAKAAQDHAGQ